MKMRQRKHRLKGRYKFGPTVLFFQPSKDVKKVTQAWLIQETMPEQTGSVRKFFEEWVKSVHANTEFLSGERWEQPINGSALSNAVKRIQPIAEQYNRALAGLVNAGKKKGEEVLAPLTKIEFTFNSPLFKKKEGPPSS